MYTMRFDKASALYGEFGRFYVGYLTDIGTARRAGAVAHHRPGALAPPAGRQAVIVIGPLSTATPEASNTKVRNAPRPGSPLSPSVRNWLGPL